MSKTRALAYGWMIVLAAAAAAAPQHAAKADSGTPVEAIEVSGLRAYAGRTLNVFYVAGREAALGVAGSDLKIRRILKGPVRVDISSAGEADVPATSVPRAGFVAFNYIVFAVSNGSAPLYLRNTDGTYPDDPRLSPDAFAGLPDQVFRSDRMGFTSLRGLDQHRSASGGLVLDARRGDF